MTNSTGEPGVTPRSVLTNRTKARTERIAFIHASFRRRALRKMLALVWTRPAASERLTRPMVSALRMRPARAGALSVIEGESI